uniref:Uncharacterized protein n=1 Tax=Siphoviridae sp. ctNEy24 TaxID=2825466 RepID=A0A8S5U0H3_9CAUD|nr:MAG TPA: hypothetical protein [Siphoviridae sp. ctNEy24]
MRCQRGLHQYSKKSIFLWIWKNRQLYYLDKSSSIYLEDSKFRMNHFHSTSPYAQRIEWNSMKQCG